VLLIDPEDGDDVLRHNRERGRYYEFDKVFDDTATQHQVFRKTTQGLVPTVISGFNTTVFAYGKFGVVVDDMSFGRYIHTYVILKLF
jgi:kinesin family protein 18/19